MGINRVSEFYIGALSQTARSPDYSSSLSSDESRKLLLNLFEKLFDIVMGCASSTRLSVNRMGGSPKGKRKSKKLDKDSEGQEISDLEVNKIRECILQRHDSKVDLVAQISAERDALKTISSVKIERTNSCEDLMNAMNVVDIVELSNMANGHYRVQKELKVALLKQAMERDCKRWVVRRHQCLYYYVQNIFDSINDSNHVNIAF